VKVELLYFDGCPSYEALLPRLREIASAEGLADDLELRRVESPEEAERERFLGSPTVRVDGEDVEANARVRTDYGLKCRLYRTAAGALPVPPEEMIRDALRAAA
jgi:hypothetical protein